MSQRARSFTFVDAHADLAEVLLLVGKADEAAAALEQALGCYERKGTASRRNACRRDSASSREAASR